MEVIIILTIQELGGMEICLILLCHRFIPDISRYVIFLMAKDWLINGHRFFVWQLHLKLVIVMDRFLILKLQELLLL